MSCASLGESAQETAAYLVAELSRRGETVVFCESLTAGLASATLASVPGASAVLLGGLVTYATRLKHELAGVPAELLARRGPVSEETACAMAAGVRRVTGAEWGVSLTGVAGPDRQDGREVGEVWVGIATPAGDTMSRRAGEPLLPGNREDIRREAVASALRLLAAAVREAG